MLQVTPKFGSYLLALSTLGRNFSVSAPSFKKLSATAAAKATSVKLSKISEKEITKEEKRFLMELQEEWSKTRPLLGKKILINAHMTLITLDLIALFISAGAEVETTAASELVVHENALKPLQKSGIIFYKDAKIPEEKRNNYYDIVLDCGAGLIDKVTPQIGMTELTHTQPHLYEGISYPVISVDTSKTKELETGFGTGDSITRLLLHLSKISIMQMLYKLFPDKANTKDMSSVEKHTMLAMFGLMNVDNLFKDKKYMIFGYGKVGKGIAAALRNAGTLPSNIFIIDISSHAYMQIKEDGYSGIFHESGENDAEVRKLFSSMHAVITATGIPSAISQCFDPVDFNTTPLLVNMGTHDEFGEKFSKEQIINEKKPGNFLLSKPTEVKFLDPIFYIWAKGALELLQRTDLKPGLQGVSKQADSEILGKWMKVYAGSIWTHQEEAHALNEDIKSILSRSHSPTKLDVKSLSKKFGLFMNNGLMTHHSCGVPLNLENQSARTSRTENGYSKT